MPGTSNALEAGRSGCVMVVDDDAACLEATRSLIAQWGYQPVGFATFADARAYVAKEAPHAALVDVRLGHYNGLQLLHLLRQSHPGCILVAVSGFADPVLKAEAERIGAHYLTKPLDLVALRLFIAAAEE